MNPICIKHRTKIEPFGLFTEACLECIEEAAIQSAMNMGIPDYYICGYCGSRCSSGELIKHLETKRCIIGLVK